MSRLLYWYNLVGIVIWAVLLIPTLLWWRENIFWIVLMSWFAIFDTKVAGWVASRVERTQDEGDAYDGTGDFK